MERQNDEALARALSRGGAGNGAAEALRALGRYLDTAEGRALLARFSASSGDAVRGAAQAAARGDEAAARQGLAALLSTPEGAALAAVIAAAGGRGGGHG